MSAAAPSEAMMLCCSCLRAVLAEFEFGFDAGDGDFEADDVAEHAIAVGLAKTGPLVGVGGLEHGDQFVEDGEQFVGGGEGAGVAVDVDRAVVPGGNDFARGVVRGRNVGVGAVEDGEALRLLIEVTPVRVGFGDVAAEEEMVPGFADNERGVGGEGAIGRGGNQDGERVRVHEGEGVGVVADSEVFGDIHGLIFSYSVDLCRPYGTR